MVRFVKLLFPYVQLAFIGWVVWTADVPQWKVVASVLLLVWVALGVTALRVALAALIHGFTAQSDTVKLLRAVDRASKQRR